MTVGDRGDAALVDITGLVKQHGALRPLRVTRLVVHRGERIAIEGLDAGAAETLIHVITGAAVADEGEVRVAGRDTRDISTDTEWLASLDRFGIVTERAVLLDALSIAANLALPLTVAIDPLPHDVRSAVETLAAAVDIGPDRLDAVAGTLSAEERVRVHLARAIAPAPELLLLEHPTAHLDPPAAERLGDTLKRVADARGLGFLALSADASFARATGARRLRLAPATGELSEASGRWWRRA
jgi:predicted ABC-type transport system involved in lysophospholipase L1 biosynthesis ATPase subunit